jgi:hypothetical protein
LTRQELEEKAVLLAEHSGAATAAEMVAIFAQIKDLTKLDKIGIFLR